MLRPPPTSTLFPYTTLFRSVLLPAGDLRASVVRIDLDRDLDGERDAPGARDRKSTRLNSSHVKISYAVFCLKKKKIGLDELMPDIQARRCDLSPHLRSPSHV